MCQERHDGVESPLNLKTIDLNRFQCATADSSAAAQQPLQVWVLFGGDGTGRQVSLSSGINLWLKLRQFSDVQVYPFLLVPVSHWRHGLTSFLNSGSESAVYLDCEYIADCNDRN